VEEKQRLNVTAGRLSKECFFEGQHARQKFEKPTKSKKKVRKISDQRQGGFRCKQRKSHELLKIFTKVVQISVINLRFSSVSNRVLGLLSGIVFV
jgi:hypothetical protein